MRTLNNFLNKPVICLSNGKTMGKITGMLFNKKMTRLLHFILLPEQEESERQETAPPALKTLAYNKIYNFGIDAVVIKSESLLEENITLFDLTNPLNAKVYNTKGLFIGTCTNVTLKDEKNESAWLELDSRRNLNIYEIANSGKDTVIIYSDGQRIKIPSNAKPKPRTPPEKKESVFLRYEIPRQSANFAPAPVITQTEVIPRFNNPSNVFAITLSLDEKDKLKRLIESSSESVVIKKDDLKILPREKYQDSNGEFRIPVRVLGEYKFLLFRKVNKNIYNSKNELLIKSGQLITAEVVELAKQNGKIVELTRASLNNY